MDMQIGRNYFEDTNPLHFWKIPSPFDLLVDWILGEVM